MKRYKVPVILRTIETGYVEVDAKDEEQARERASDSSIDLIVNRSVDSWELTDDWDDEVEIVQDEEIDK